jgi:hypothetical protein
MYSTACRVRRRADHGLGGRGHGRHDHRRKRLRERLRAHPGPSIRLHPRPCRPTLSSHARIVGGSDSANGKHWGVGLARALNTAGDGMGARHRVARQETAKQLNEGQTSLRSRDRRAEGRRKMLPGGLKLTRQRRARTAAAVLRLRRRLRARSRPV